MIRNDVVFFDIEADGKRSVDIGAVTSDHRIFHSARKDEFIEFLSGTSFAVGHNIFAHDLRFLESVFEQTEVTRFIDTLMFSPLLFPSRPYHKLIKDYKLDTDEVNNPVNDSKLSKEVFDSEVAAFSALDYRLKSIYYTLLNKQKEFKDFFVYLNFDDACKSLVLEVKNYFKNKLCENAPIDQIASKYPVELAYALAIITAHDKYSITPPWVLITYPKVENVLYFLRSRHCLHGCEYCNSFTNEMIALKNIFGYDFFRKYGGENLQQRAAKAAIDNKSLLAVFPTGGGKSITFQLPALMAYKSVKGLTVVISPLQSLMKDQVDNLAKKHGITEAATINGQLTSLEVAAERKRIEDGEVAILYISPESLRSKSMQSLLLKRNVVRFVIDEAHCFSVWGQTFRVDYQYIGEFIKNYQDLKNMSTNIPISCFTATAKQRVIADIKEYFKEKLNVELDVFSARATRTNLAYHVIMVEEGEKFEKLKDLLSGNEKPVIIYVSRTRKAEELATRLTGYGFKALPYHGQMDNEEKIKNQESFMSGETRIIVATTAFGMGVDKDDVGMVIHYNISDSLENYVQEAGRAGRKESMNADCYILFNDEDLNKHFILLNQTKLSNKEIQQIWRAVKNATKTRNDVTLSALDLAREAGWSDAETDIETRVKTAVSELEQAAFLVRGQNMPKIFANSIDVKNMAEAVSIIDNSGLFDTKDAEHAKRIMKSLISARSRSKGGDADAESRIDYISDNLGIVRGDVIRVVNLLRQANILSDAKDFTAYLKSANTTAPEKRLESYRILEELLINSISEKTQELNIKAFFEEIEGKCGKITINDIKALLNYLKIKKVIEYNYKRYDDNYARADYIEIKSKFGIDELKQKADKRWRAAEKIIAYLYSKYKKSENTEKEQPVEFSRLELIENHKSDLFAENVTIEEIDDALFYLLKIRALKIEGEFLVVYNRMQLQRTAETSEKYKKEHYQHLANHYESRIEQIHIVGEYARKMIESDEAAATFVNDYFFMENSFFMHKYFAGRIDEIKRNMTKAKYNKLFGELSETQLKIINDKKSKYIAVAAGPGSGKTKLLTHKLASLYISEDVKHEQMLMLTFSRAAATEFKKRLMGLIGNAANYITISTFYSFCFDLLGRVGNLDKTESIIKSTIEALKNNEVDQNKIGKLVLVIDEAQDISEEEYELVSILMEKNEEMRVIAVGDDDQSIYEFRGSSPKYLKEFASLEDTASYELVENYRSRKNIVCLANSFIEKMPDRLKKHSIKPKSIENGIVLLYNHLSKNLVIPVSDSVIKNITDNSLNGTTCVLTKTNDEVMQIGALLLRRGINVRYVSDNNKISIGDLVELRYFCSLLNLEDDQSIINPEAWERAKRQLILEYVNSELVNACISAINDFEEVNNKNKYKNDLLIYLKESKLEDFIKANSGEVLVSTIHQSKGREFDNVFLALSNYYLPIKDEERRAIYVALTRAKKNLFVHYNNGLFNDLSIDNVEKTDDNMNYEESPEIAVQCTQKSVVLDSFFYYQTSVGKLYAGTDLNLDEKGCLHGSNRVLLFSASFKNDLLKWKDKGYLPYSAKVNTVIYWKKKEDENSKPDDPNIGKETKIVLPIVYLKK